MAKLPKREDAIYQEIEKFKTYELTPCVAYEMAIRNQDVKDLLHNLDRLDKYKDKAMLVRVSNDEELSRSLRYFEMIEKDHKAFMDNFEDFQEIGMSHIAKLQEILENDLIENYRIYPKGYYRKTVGMSELLGERIENKSDNELGNYDDDSINASRRVYEGFKVYQGLYSDKKKHFANHILPNFKRQVNDEPILITLDLSRPIAEIEAYIAHMQKTLNSSKRRSIKLPSELRGETVEQADNISHMRIISEKGTIKTFNGIKAKSSFKFADMFFIYDALKNKKTELIIRTEISEYYQRQAHKTTEMSDTTFRLYRDIITDYIDNGRYKELIIGAKIVKS
jgi:hypothetical protein